MTGGNSYTTTYSNTLDEVEMLAGDYQEFVYNVYTSGSAEVDLVDADLYVFIFSYGDPSSVIIQLEGQYTGSPINQFTAVLPSSSTIDLSGVYQQQPRIVFSSGETYNPGQGKITIFPSPSAV
jgi:hypothetical protein